MKKKGIVKPFYIIALIYAILSVISTIPLLFVSISINNPVYSAFSFLMLFFSIGIFVLSIVAIVSFIKVKSRRILLVLPVYYVIMMPLLIIASFIYGIIIAASGEPLDSLELPVFMIVISLILSTFELVFSSTILKNLKKYH